MMSAHDKANLTKAKRKGVMRMFREAAQMRRLNQGYSREAIRARVQADKIENKARVMWSELEARGEP